MDVIISYFLPLLFIIGLALFNSVIFKMKFENVVAFGLIQSVLLAYIFGFIDLRIGLFISILMSVISIPACVYAKRKKDYYFNDMFVTDMFWVFIILYTIIFVLNIGKTFYKWDEFSHWGMMAKEMFRLDKYYYVEESTLVYHREYPPFTSIMQYIWCKLCGEYKERHLYNAKIIISLAVLFPIYSSLVNVSSASKNIFKRIGEIVSVSFFFLLISNVITIGEAYFYRTIYAEGVLCMLVLLAVCTMYIKPLNYKFHILNMGSILAAILLTKQMGIYFFGCVIIGYYLLKYIRKEKLVVYSELLLVTLIPIVMWFFWQIVTKINTPIGQFDSSRFSIEKIVEIFMGNAPEYRYITINAFISAIIKNPLVGGGIKLSYLSWLVVFLILVMICIKLDNGINKKSILTIGLVLEIAAIGYIPVMMVLYLFGFSEAEAMGLACYKRYMNTMLYPMILFILFVILNILLKSFASHKKIIYIGAILSVFASISFEDIIVEFTPGIMAYNVSSIFQRDAEIINQNTELSDSIYVICQGDNSSARNIIAYLTAPRMISTDNYSVGKDEVEEVISYMKNFDYVYLSGIDSVFIESYGTLFGEDFTKENQQLYKVNIVDEEASLKRIYWE